MPERDDDGLPLCDCVVTMTPGIVRPEAHAVLRELDTRWGRMAHVAFRDCSFCHGTGYAPERISVRRDLHEALVAALRALCEAQRYYAEHADESERMPGNDLYSDKFMAVVRQARAALAMVDGEKEPTP